MKYLLAVALFAATPAVAQTAAAPTPAPVAVPAPAGPAVAAAKFSLDTPIELLVADPAAKAVLTADLGGDITANPSYDQFKSMSINQIKPYAPDKLPDTLTAKIATDLAAIK
ncbi:MAG: hypothetical protein J0J06_16110 [Sphingomonas sp.]|uniref:hypothetical protein n=1 Tax=Sphingomonas sp. TaxID=28214 RepID=UPI001ACB3130|nr:hypothetical protein [Sphingomonas sp.]MBN8816958.1 hypothetical protein [Sphingomonas sp.]